MLPVVLVWLVGPTLTSVMAISLQPFSLTGTCSNCRVLFQLPVVVWTVTRHERPYANLGVSFPPQPLEHIVFFFCFFVFFQNFNQVYYTAMYTLNKSNLEQDQYDQKCLGTWSRDKPKKGHQNSRSLTSQQRLKLGPCAKMQQGTKTGTDGNFRIYLNWSASH